MHLLLALLSIQDLLCLRAKTNFLLLTLSINQQISFSVHCLVSKISENCETWPLQFPRARVDLFKSLVFFQPTVRYPIYHHRRLIKIKYQIFTFGKLEPENFGHFCLKELQAINLLSKFVQINVLSVD